MESHERTERCKEIFALLSDYLNLELPPDACAGKSKLTSLAGRLASNSTKAFVRLWNFAIVTGRPSCQTQSGRKRGNPTPSRLPKKLAARTIR
jgi:hypothetical protein